MQHEILATMATTSPDTKFEITLERETGDEPVIELRRFSWGNGVGWYCQQTMRLAPEEADALLQTLRQSRRKWQEQSAQHNGKVIPFPSGSVKAR